VLGALCIGHKVSKKVRYLLRTRYLDSSSRCKIEQTIERECDIMYTGGDWAMRLQELEDDATIPCPIKVILSTPMLPYLLE